MPTFIELVPVELPGRGRRRGEPFARTLEDALRALEHIAPTRPFALFGHSLGASLAFAFAQRHAPLMLFASASPAPGTRERAPREWSDHALRDELLRHDGTPSDVLHCPELLELALPVLRADYQLAADLGRRISRAPIAAPIHVLAGSDDDIAASELEGWRALTRGGFKQRSFAGGHFYLQDHEPALLALIAAELARAIPQRELPQGGRHGQYAER